MANINPGKGPNFFTAGANGKVIKGLGFKKLSNEERRVTRTGVRLNTANHDTSNIAYWVGFSSSSCIPLQSCRNV